MYETLIVNAATIQETIDLARFLVETTKGFILFAVRREKTVGGPVEIAAIARHGGSFLHEVHRTKVGSPAGA